jgi:hypothetical protein
MQRGYLMDWPFSDPPNVAVFTTRKIVEGKGWIVHVTHDADDGAWQFLGLSGAEMEEARVVSLREIVERNEAIKELADLPLGWHAWRESKTGKWMRQPNV